MYVQTAYSAENLSSPYPQPPPSVLPSGTKEKKNAILLQITLLASKFSWRRGVEERGGDLCTYFFLARLALLTTMYLVCSVVSFAFFIPFLARLGNAASYT